MNICIGFWTLRLKCTQDGLYEQATFKNARLIFLSNIFQNRVEWTTIFCWDMKFSYLFLGVARKWRIAGPRPYPPPLKVRRGRFSICPGKLSWHRVYNTQSTNDMCPTWVNNECSIYRQRTKWPCAGLARPIGLTHSTIMLDAVSQEKRKRKRKLVRCLESLQLATPKFPRVCVRT